MLPAIAASASINSGTPIAAITAYSRFCANCSKAGPSTRNIHELAIRLRSGVSIPPPIDPENVDSTSVPPAIMNQVLTSWLLATSPRSWASSRRFWVGSCVLSEESFSSAIDRLSAQRHQVVHDTAEIIQEGSHHRRDHEGEDQEAGENS